MESFYRSYLTLCNQNAKNFKEDLFIRAEEVKEEVVKLDDKNPEYLEQVLLIASLVNISNMYRRVAEKLVDEIAK